MGQRRVFAVCVRLGDHEVHCGGPAPVCTLVPECVQSCVTSTQRSVASAAPFTPHFPLTRPLHPILLCVFFFCWQAWNAKSAEDLLSSLATAVSAMRRVADAAVSAHGASHGTATSGLPGADDLDASSPVAVALGIAKLERTSRRLRRLLAKETGLGVGAGAGASVSGSGAGSPSGSSSARHSKSLKSGDGSGGAWLPPCSSASSPVTPLPTSHTLPTVCWPRALTPHLFRIDAPRTLYTRAPCVSPLLS